MYDLLGTEETWPGIYVSLAARSPHQERLLLINQTQEPNSGLTSPARVTPPLYSVQPDTIHYFYGSLSSQRYEFLGF